MKMIILSVIRGIRVIRGSLQKTRKFRSRGSDLFMGSKLLPLEK